MLNNLTLPEVITVDVIKKITYNEHMFSSESPVNDRKHFELLLTVARRYYLDDAKQSEIAEEIGIEHGSDGGIAHLGVIEFRDIAINH